MTPSSFFSFVKIDRGSTVWSRSCVFWREDVGEWHSDGLSIGDDTDTQYTVCLSSHMTSFAVMFVSDLSLFIPFNKNQCPFAKYTPLFSFQTCDIKGVATNQASRICCNTFMCLPLKFWNCFFVIAICHGEYQQFSSCTPSCTGNVTYTVSGSYEYVCMNMNDKMGICLRITTYSVRKIMKSHILHPEYDIKTKMCVLRQQFFFLQKVIIHPLLDLIFPIKIVT